MDSAEVLRSAAGRTPCPVSQIGRACCWRVPWHSPRCWSPEPIVLGGNHEVGGCGQSCQGRDGDSAHNRCIIELHKHRGHVRIDDGTQRRAGAAADHLLGVDVLRLRCGTTTSSCYVRVLVDGAEAAPGQVLFDSARDGGSPLGQEANSMQFVAGPLSAGS